MYLKKLQFTILYLKQFKIYNYLQFTIMYLKNYNLQLCTIYKYVPETNHVSRVSP